MSAGTFPAPKKRRRQAKAQRRHPVRKISYQRFWREVTNDGKGPCALSGPDCRGILDAHHFFPKRRIDLQLGGKHHPRSIAAKLDTRNGVCLCRFHHERIENPNDKLEVPAPPELAFFLVDHGLHASR